MSYPVQPPPIAATPPPVSSSGRPPVVTVAAALLWLMAGVGLIYAIVTVAVVPGTISRFRDVTGTQALQRFTGDNDPEYYVAVVWLGAAIALALAVIAFALFVVVGLSLRRGSNVARIATLVVCVLGIAGGTAGVLTVAAQRSGNSAPWSLGAVLSDAYPHGWIGANAGLSIAQILGYALVGILILTAPRAFFRRPAAPSAPQPAYPGSGQLVGAFPGGYPTPSGHPGAGFQPPTGTGYPAGGFPGHPGAAMPPAAGYGPGGQPSPSGYGPDGRPFTPTGPGAVDGSSRPMAGPAQPWSAAPDHSPYARPAGHAPDATFASPTPAQPAPVQYPPADPHSPYARPAPEGLTQQRPSDGAAEARPAADHPTEREGETGQSTAAAPAHPLEGADHNGSGAPSTDSSETKPPTPS